MMLCRLCWGLALGCLMALSEPSLMAAKKKASADNDEVSPKKKDEERKDRHEVRRGETLWGIARKYEVSVGEMMDLNHLPNDKVHEGQVLKIPQPAPEVDPTGAPPPIIHVFAKGETFRSIARANGITQDELEHANPKVDSDHPKIGTKLKIPQRPAVDGESGAKARETGSTGAAKSKYVVTEKDTYYSIAKAHGLTTSAIAKANPDVAPERLRPGMTLVLPPAPAKTPTHGYVISRGESAQSIAEAFGISVKKLCELNGKKTAASFEEGSEIQVPNR